MTKSEATAIVESTSRALRALGVDLPWTSMSDELKSEVYQHIKEAEAEIRRIGDMATAELGGRR